MNPLLILDSNYLAYRAYHSLPELTYDDVPTAVVFGFLRDVTSLMDQFDTERIVFCFDCQGRTLRQDRLPTYKSTRREKRRNGDFNQRQAHKSLRRQIKALEVDYLASLGFRNVFSQQGYEADDIIAAIAQARPATEPIIIVASDKDLYQLLAGNVSIWNPQQRKSITLQSFYTEWQIYPAQWPKVKAIAGCSTDDIPGIRGVGEKTAAKFINGTLKPQSKAHNTIIMEGLKCMKRNLGLVTLPMKGIGEFKIRKDRVTQDKWEALADRLGLDSFKKDPPIPSRMRRRHALKKTQRPSVRARDMQATLPVVDQGKKGRRVLENVGKRGQGHRKKKEKPKDGGGLW